MKNQAKKTDIQLDGLSGSVKQLKQTCYKTEEKDYTIVPGEIEYSLRNKNENYIRTYNEDGIKIKEQSFYVDGDSSEITYNDKRSILEENTYANEILALKKVHHYDKKGNCLKIIHYNKEGKDLKTGITYRYDDKGNELGYTILNEDGGIRLRTNARYDDKDRLIEREAEHEKAFERQNGRTTYCYNDKGYKVETNYYKPDGSLDYKHSYIYDDDGRCIEDKSEYAEREYNERTTYHYDANGYLIEENNYDEDELVTKTTYLNDSEGNILEQRLEEDGVYRSKQIFTYDADGKRIEKKVYDADGSLSQDMVYNEYGQEKSRPSSLISYRLKKDAQGNWIEKITLYNNIPLTIHIREILYFGEQNKNDMLTWIHPLAKDKKQMTTHLKVTTVKSKSNAKPENQLSQAAITPAQAQWLVEMGLPENFSTIRYYALHNNEWPSVLNYSISNIEAISLLRDLQKDLQAVLVHTNRHKLGGREAAMSNYTLSFPNNPGYLLHAVRMQYENGNEYNLPDFISNGNPYTPLYTSPFQLLHPSDGSGKRDLIFEKKIDKHIELHFIFKKPDKPTIYMIETDNGTWSLEGHPVSDDFEIKDLDINYGYGFSKFHDDLMVRFNKETKGLVLFHGEPGTGKTYYIRHLLRKMASNNKVVIYMPPNMVDFLVDPGFITFLQKELSNWAADGFFCVLLIEDAEPLLAKREEGVRIQGVTNLLNMSDGLLNDMLNVQIICTFNVDLRKLDSALLRPGRLIARKEFKPLTELDANLLAQRLGIKHHFTAPATLSEVYAMLKNKSTLIHDVDPSDGASTNIDDLL